MRGLSPAFSYSLGITNAASKYAKSPQPKKQTENTASIRRIVGSIPKYSPTPPQTPKIFRLVALFVNFFSIVFFIIISIFP